MFAVALEGKHILLLYVDGVFLTKLQVFQLKMFLKTIQQTGYTLCQHFLNFHI